MNWLDLLIIIIVGLSTIGGFSRGALKTLLLIASVVIAIRESWRITPWVSNILAKNFNITGSFSSFFTSVVAFLIVFGICWIISVFLNKLPKLGLLGLLNRLVGAACGFIISILIFGYLSFAADKMFPVKFPDDTGIRTEESVKQDARLESRYYFRIQSFIEGFHWQEYIHKLKHTTQEE